MSLSTTSFHLLNTSQETLPPMVVDETDWSWEARWLNVEFDDLKKLDFILEVFLNLNDCRIEAAVRQSLYPMGGEFCSV